MDDMIDLNFYMDLAKQLKTPLTAEFILGAQLSNMVAKIRAAQGTDESYLCMTIVIDMIENKNKIDPRFLVYYYINQVGFKSIRSDGAYIESENATYAAEYMKKISDNTKPSIQAKYDELIKYNTPYNKFNDLLASADMADLIELYKTYATKKRDVLSIYLGLISSISKATDLEYNPDESYWEKVLAFIRHYGRLLAPLIELKIWYDSESRDQFLADQTLDNARKWAGEVYYALYIMRNLVEIPIV